MTGETERHLDHSVLKTGLSQPTPARWPSAWNQLSATYAAQSPDGFPHIHQKVVLRLFLCGSPATVSAVSIWQDPFLVFRAAPHQRELPLCVPGHPLTAVLAQRWVLVVSIVIPASAAIGG